MTRYATWMLAAVLGCTKDEENEATDASSEGDADTDTDADADTDTDATPVEAAACALTANALRITCTATLEAPGSVTLVLSAPGAATRTFVSADATEHEILGWGLVADTAYTWSIGTQSGTVTTGPLPAALADAAIATTGAATGFDAVLYPLACPGDDYFTMIDSDGRIVWYEQNDVYFGAFMAGYDWSQADLTVLSVGEDRFQEQHVSGDVVLDLAGGGVDFEHTLHHDTARWGDLRYLLFEYPVGALFVDGVHVFDGPTRIGTWLMGDDFTVPDSGEGDWGHANGLKVTETGEIVLSLHTFSSVLTVDGDPASPTFLQSETILNGGKGGLPDPDYVPVDGPGEGFRRQHNASRHGDDLWVFDNESQPTSRALRMALDPATGTLTTTGSWSFDETCKNQGGAIPLAGGGVLASCANVGKVWQFDEAATEPGWTLEADCGEDLEPGSLPILRGIPVMVE